MKKKTFGNIVLWSAVALIVPLLGNAFVDGWNWTWHDFLFAWAFFIVLGSTYMLVRARIANRTYKILAGAAVIALFVAIWAMLATG